MLCSLPAGKAGPNWLDRLRSNKGFPIAHNLDLDHFLTNQNHPDSTPPNPISHPRDNSSTNSPALNGNPGPGSGSGSGSGSYAIITGILSDLFNMTAASQISKCSRKKFPRKQSTPKICSIPSLNTDENKQLNILSSNSNNKPQNVRAKLQDEEVDDEIKGDKELIGYSKSEVTVIDTSCDVWKSDKLIFRRKNVWKVKDKKGKLRSYGRKSHPKQSAQTNDLPDMIASPTKKTKLWGSEERFHFNNAQQIRGKESLKPLNKGYNAPHCSGPEMSANAPDSSNHKKENVYTLLQENGSYDPEKSDQPRA